MENRIHIQIPEADMKAIMDALKVIEEKTKPFIHILDAQERRDLPKMGEASEPFVEKTIDYAKSNPEFMPPYVKADDMEVDFKSVQQLNKIVRPMRQLLDGLEDTNMLAGSEAYVAALSYYNSVKLGNRMNMPGALAIYEDLKKRFKQKPKKKD